MKLVQFYRGEIPNNEGSFITDIMAYSYYQLEADHAYIQYILPLRERSMFNVEAPILTDDEIILFCSDPELTLKTYSTALKMLDFFGMYLHGTDVGWQEPDPQHGHKDPKWWLRDFNHNFLRMTRMLTSLRYFGYDEISLSTYNCLLESGVYFSKESHEYWTDAATGPLP